MKQITVTMFVAEGFYEELDIYLDAKIKAYKLHTAIIYPEFIQ
jgi:hypothetical protein